MAQASDTWGILYQNLIDAGCDPEMAQQCVLLAKEKNIAALRRLLSHHRTILLDTVHENQKRIDCLDFLIYHLRKEEFQ